MPGSFFFVSPISPDPHPDAASMGMGLNGMAFGRKDVHDARRQFVDHGLRVRAGHYPRRPVASRKD